VVGAMSIDEIRRRFRELKTLGAWGLSRKSAEIFAILDSLLDHLDNLEKWKSSIEQRKYDPPAT